MLHGIEGLLKEDLIDLRSQPNHVWSQLLNTPSAALGTCRYKLQVDDPQRAIGLLRRYDVRYLLYIGGNDSAEPAHPPPVGAPHTRYDLPTIKKPPNTDNDAP